MATEKPTPEEQQANIVYLRLQCSPGEGRLPEYCIKAYAHYCAKDELEKMTYQRGYRNTGYAQASEGQNEPTQDDPRKILWNTLKMGSGVEIPPSLDFATLFTDLGRRGSVGGTHSQRLLEKMRDENRLIEFSINLSKDLPLPITATKLYDMLQDPTPEAAQMLSKALHKALLGDSKQRARINTIRESARKYLDELANPQSPPQAEAAKTPAILPRDFALVARALHYLQQCAPAPAEPISPEEIAARYNGKYRASPEEETSAVHMNAQIVERLFEGKPPIDIKKTSEIDVQIANLLLPGPQGREPDAAVLLSSVLGEAPEFTSVTQLVELGRAIRDKRVTPKAAAGRADDNAPEGKSSAEKSATGFSRY